MFDYTMIRSSRKTIALQITPDGKLIVRCPRRMKADAVQMFVESKAGWIEKHMAKVSASTGAVPLAPEELMELAKQAKADIPQRVAAWAPRVGASYGRITIRAQRSRWGSCSSKGNLNFNCLLMLAPEAVRDYVVIHELCHRKHMDHSDAFWAEVARVCPDYPEHKRWLKHNGTALIARLGNG